MLSVSFHHRQMVAVISAKAVMFARLSSHGSVEVVSLHRLDEVAIRIAKISLIKFCMK